ncbi:hypothetical protein [Anabaena lutea]|uniref:Phage protein n=1 Tax=Anabaena lutea FACHB-196 TaxID=2692881 RepID=A0ABR8FLL1_9NOST|nr:hypothetical protein [Anabaena lutea]MBD2569710.1 hypothetical protein [Anabaena lutea FACHB-196]
MNIKLIHTHFTIPTGNGGRERIGFTAELEPGETIEQVVTELREKAAKQVGKTYQTYYSERYELRNEVIELEDKLKKLRAEWDATAEFLRSQGINPKAPSMPQFERLLKAASGEMTVEVEVVEEEEDCYQDEDDDDDDYI